MDIILEIYSSNDDIIKEVSGLKNEEATGFLMSATYNDEIGASLMAVKENDIYSFVAMVEFNEDYPDDVSWVQATSHQRVAIREVDSSDYIDDNLIELLKTKLMLVVKNIRDNGGN